ncbi:MAG: hypothetical protein RIR79_871 [Pseudomonadota bacterium]
MARHHNAQFLHYKQWQMDSLALGKLFLPALEKMAKRIPHLQCTVLCTHDGFNICSLGLREDQVGRMAALSSSLLSVGQATVNIVATEAGLPPLEVMTMECGGVQTVFTTIPMASTRMVLMASSKAPLGAVLVGIRAASIDLQRLHSGK